MKTCTECGVEKALDQFGSSLGFRADGRPQSADGLKHNCKQCVNKKAIAWRNANKDKVNEQRRKKYEERYPIIQDQNMKWRYGIGIDQYDAKLKEQNGKCAICGSTDPKSAEAGIRPRRFAIDHNHDTEAVRGLLCNPCNRGIGILGDSINRLEAAIAYLKKYQTCTS